MKQKQLLKLSLSLLLVTETFALPLKNVLENTLTSNSEIKSLRSNTEAYKYYVDEEFGNYLPTINVDAYLEEKDSTDRNIPTNVETDKKQDGYNTIIKIDQMLYDGGLTPFKVAEAEHNYKANKIKNISIVEDILYETIQSYLETVKYKELELLTKNNVKVHEGYLATAKDSEEISGETLDRLQVESKLLNSQSLYVKEKREARQAYAKLSKLTGLEVKSQICRPLLKKNNISTLNSLIEEGLLNNYSILEELEKIEAQKSILSQEISKFLPTIKARLSQEYDKDLDAKDIYKEETSARISLAYNIFNGLKDKATYQREKIFLQESQSRMDDIVSLVKEEIISQKAIYDSSFKRIDYLKDYITTSKNILVITKEQFEGGTKTFLDVLNSEADLYRARKDLVDEEYVNFLAYYELLNLTAKLSNTIFESENQVCEVIKIDLTLPKMGKKNELDELLEDVNDEKIIDDKKDIKEIENIYENILKDVYGSKTIKFYNKSTKKQELKVKKSNDKKALSSDSLNLVNKNDKKNLLTTLKKENPKGYTLTISTSVGTQEEINKLLTKYNLQDDVLSYKLKNDGQEYIKAIYGVFDTASQARKTISSLPLVLQKNKPYVESLSLNKKLYDKYN